jgi:hypothetical protein
MHTKFWSDYLKRRDNLKNLGEDERIILKLILNTRTVRVSTGYVFLGRGPVVDMTSQFNKRSGIY